MSNFDGGGFGSGGDTFTETTRRGWFQRIGSSMSGLLIGPLLVLAAIVGLFWNEGRAVKTARSLDEGAGIVISVGAGSVDPANEGKLVHVSAPVVPEGRPRDPATGIEADGLRLARRVEVYQWIETSRSETRKTLGGGEETVTTYNYALGWTDKPTDGSNFKQPDGHRNPPPPVAAQTFPVERARLGAFVLNARQVGQLGALTARPVEAREEAGIRRALGGASPIRVADGRIHVGQDPLRPRLGDARLSYEVATAGPATVVARQSGGGLAAYTASNGYTIEILRDGTASAEQVFADAQSGNTMLTWLIRVVGIVVMAMGFGLFLKPLSVIGDVVPFIGTLIGGASSIVAFALAALIGSVTIAIAWFAYRPLLSLALIAGGVAIAFVLRRLAGRRGGAMAAAPRGAA